MNEDFKNRIEAFVSGLQAIIDEEYHGRKIVSYDTGRRYVKIVSTLNGDQRNSYCFIDKETGQVLKAASWSSPSKTCIGNINTNNNGLSRCTAYGC